MYMQLVFSCHTVDLRDRVVPAKQFGYVLNGMGGRLNFKIAGNCAVHFLRIDDRGVRLNDAFFLQGLHALLDGDA